MTKCELLVLAKFNLAFSMMLNRSTVSVLPGVFHEDPWFSKHQIVMFIQKLLRPIADLLVPQLTRDQSIVDIVQCEQRLAFSAVPFAAGLYAIAESHDVNADVEVPMPQASWDVQTHLIPPSTQVDDYTSSPIESHNVPGSASSAAHTLTGLNIARQRFGLTGIGQTVAIIDTGIAYDHVALGAGYGANFRVLGGYDFAENDTNPYDDAPAGYHGTAVAGVVGGTATGVAPGVDFVALRVFNDLGQGSLQSVEAALRWIHTNYRNFENPISIVNLSLGVDFNTANPPAGSILEDELLALKNEGILVIASAGNQFAKYQTPGLAYPASSSLVLPVSSVDANGQMSSFSQRDTDALAAPGRNISSTVPDYMLGADGNPNDYSTVSGTSFSAPYVAGASALIRQAYGLLGIDNVSVDTIRNVLFTTADSVYDAVTNLSYSRLNILNALDSILPDDSVGNTAQTALALNHGGATTGSWSGFINEIGDQDFYRWTATASGTLELDFSSNHLQNSHWLISSGSQFVTQNANGNYVLQVVAGTSYTFGVGDSDQIGLFNVSWNFTPTQVNPSGPQGTPTEIGIVDLRTIDATANGLYAIESSNDGTLSIQLRDNASMQSLRIFTQDGRQVQADNVVENGVLRVDFEVTDGTRYLVQTAFSSGTAKLDIANVVQRSGSNILLLGTVQSDDYAIDLTNGVTLDVGAIEYRYSAGTVSNLQIRLAEGSDKLSIVGSQNSETVYLYSNHGSIQSTAINVAWTGSETVHYNGQGGSDRVYAFDTDGNDQLTIYPRRFQLDGAGYQFVVTQADRLYVDASRGGNDQAYLFDSAGDDSLSIRPQFSSIRGNGFFSFVTGFERVYAYATAGGNDTATLYDSVSNDVFSTNGDTASIVGNNYFAYTRFFESVESISSSGGRDTASIFSPQGANNFIGSDFISFQHQQWERTARGFNAIQTSIVAASIAPRTSAASFATDDAEILTGDSNAALGEVWSSNTSAPTNATPDFSIDTNSATMSLAKRFEADFAIDDRNSNGIESHSVQVKLPSAWISESADDIYALQKIDPLTLTLMDQDNESHALRKFFEEFAQAKN